VIFGVLDDHGYKIYNNLEFKIGLLNDLPVEFYVN
jgi:hypothetical protein